MTNLSKIFITTFSILFLIIIFIFINISVYDKDKKIDTLQTVSKLKKDTKISLSYSYLENNRLYPYLKPINYKEFIRTDYLSKKENK